jgi:DNA polymerase III subunit beta
MNIECVKDRLTRALSKAERITGKNITLPILSCVLLEVEDSILTIKATNLDLGIEIKLPVKMTTPGRVAVSGSVLNSFISNLTNDKNVTLESIEGNLKVHTKHSESIIKAFPADDFPTIPKVEDEHPFQLGASELIKGLKSVMYSASVSTMRPVLSSILIYSEEDSIVFVATDSFRLAEKRVKVKKHKDFNQILIPFKNVTEIIRTLEDIKDEVDIHLNQNQIAFSYEDIYITSRIIDGSFPDYKQIIPKDIKTDSILLKQDFISALRISNIFSDKFSQVVFRMSPQEKDFTITTKNMDVGENVNHLDAVVKGEEITISFNYKYIIDCFQSIDSDSISLSFSDSNRPMIINGVSDKSFLYLVMPMNK